MACWNCNYTFQYTKKGSALGVEVVLLQNRICKKRKNVGIFYRNTVFNYRSVHIGAVVVKGKKIQESDNQRYHRVSVAYYSNVCVDE